MKKLFFYPKAYNGLDEIKVCFISSLYLEVIKARTVYTLHLPHKTAQTVRCFCYNFCVLKKILKGKIMPVNVKSRDLWPFTIGTFKGILHFFWK